MEIRWSTFVVLFSGTGYFDYNTTLSESVVRIHDATGAVSDPCSGEDCNTHSFMWSFPTVFPTVPFSKIPVSSPLPQSSRDYVGHSVRSL